MKNILSLTSLFIFAFIVLSYDKSGRNKIFSPPTNGHSLKLKTKITGIVSTGNSALINLAFNGAETAAPATKTLWKINSASQ